MTSRREFLGLMAAVPATLAAAGPALAAEPRVFQRRGVAIGGYDPVAYFTQAKPVRGDAAFAADHDGATFHFASAENKATFEANTAKYAPQYGGYCAFAVANGYTAKTDPDAWTVHDDKLYLNFSKGVWRRWLRDVPGNVAKGDANWPSVLG